MAGLNANAPSIVAARILCRVAEFADGSTQTSAGGAATVYSPIEQNIDVNWIDGKPIFRTVLAVAGGNKESTLTDAAFINRIETIIKPPWVGIPADVGETDLGEPPSEVKLNAVTGKFEISHKKIDYTGKTLSLILEYTKL